MVKLSLCAIVLLGLALCLSGLFWGLPSKNQALTSYHPDESISFYSLEKMHPAKLDFNPGDGFYWGSLHLYTLGAVLLAAKMVGLIRVPSREYLVNHLDQADRLYVVGRMVSVVFGVASIVLLYMVGNRLSGWRVGLFAAFLLAINPVHVSNSFFVRPDIEMLFFAIGVLYFSVRMFDEDGWSNYAWAGLWSGLAAATKYNGGAFIVAPILAHFIKHGFRNFKLLWIIPALALSGFLVGCPYAALDFKTFVRYLGLNAQMASGGNIYGPAWLSYWTVFLPLALGNVTEAVSICGIVSAALNKSHKWIWCLASFAFIYAVTVFPKHQMVCYTLPVIPFLLLFAAHFLVKIWPA